MVTGTVFVFVVQLVTFALFGVLFYSGDLFPSLALGTAFDALTAGFIGGAIMGGFTRYVFWWANSREKNHLEVIGACLILLAFVAQALNPALTLFNVPVK